MTAYADTEYQVVEMGITRKLRLKRNEVVLDRSFVEPGNIRKLCGKRRFTLAHECAHQILFQMESNEIALAMRNLAKGRRLIRYGEWFAYPDRLIITTLCDLFGVSRTAITIRLSKLGYMEERPYTEYVDPLEVMA